MDTTTDNTFRLTAEGCTRAAVAATVAELLDDIQFAVANSLDGLKGPGSLAGPGVWFDGTTIGAWATHPADESEVIEVTRRVYFRPDGWPAIRP